MNRIDPINSTADQGVACSHCGDDGDFCEVNGHRVPLCDACYADQTDLCPECSGRFFVADMARVFRASDLYCLDCASKQPGLILGRAIAAKADERRDGGR